MNVSNWKELTPWRREREARDAVLDNNLGILEAMGYV